MWRAACWARLGEADTAYEEVRYAIQENFAANGVSLYSGGNGGKPGGPFQIDANFGLVGAVVGMVVTDLPQVSFFSFPWLLGRRGGKGEGKMAWGMSI